MGLKNAFTIGTSIEGFAHSAYHVGFIRFGVVDCPSGAGGNRFRISSSLPGIEIRYYATSARRTSSLLKSGRVVRRASTSRIAASLVSTPANRPSRSSGK